MLFYENELISIRALEPEDLEVLYRWENNVTIWKLGNTNVPFSKYVLRQYIETNKNDIYTDRQVRLMIYSKELNIPVGCIDIFDFEPFHSRAGIGLLISETSFRNKGYASAAIDLVIRYCKDILSLNQLYCNITENNLPSLNLFQKKGFVISGTKINWHFESGKRLNEYFLQKFIT
jgi:diamine N-acetyltransferase